MRERQTRGAIAGQDLRERSLLSRLFRPRGLLVQIVFEVVLTGVAGLVVLWLRGG